jgi:cytochrome bd-type quinol oxidase subunit 1
MEYPIWELTTLGGGFFIALIAIFHVFVSHFAVGGGLFLPLFEKMAYDQKSDVLLDYVRKHTKFFLLLTMVFGGMTGVGIWFTISVLAPQATSTLIHTFVFGWATEWVFFLAEIAALLIYYYRWDKMGRRDHLIVGWLYFVFAWLSLFLINGIIGFMLTPGDWLETKSFWAGFLNPSFLPSLFFRTFMSFMLAGLFGFVTAHRIKDVEVREMVYKSCAKWTIIPVVLAMLSGWWYFSVLPPEALEQLVRKTARISEFYTLIVGVAVLVFAFGAAMMVRLPLAPRVAVSMILLLLGFSFIGSFEFLREASRKPYLIHGYMYSNQIRPTDMAELNEKGVLASAKWVDHDRLGTDPMVAGRKLFQLQCSNCHSIGGPMNNIIPLTQKYQVDGMNVNISKHGELQLMMPPFAGTDAERQALAIYIVKGIKAGKP